MTWNYRVVKQTSHSHLGSLVSYEIREVYYNSKAEITAVSETASPVCSDLEPGDGKDEGDALHVLELELHRFKQAIEKPIVDLDTLVFASSVL